MRILIKSDDTNIRLRFPSFLIFNGLAASVMPKKIVESTGFSRGDLRLFLKELGKVSRRYKGFEIVNVETGDGTTVVVEI